VNLVQATPPNGSPSLLYDVPGDESYPDWETLYNGNEAVAFQEQDGTDFNLLLLNRATGTVTDYGSGIHPEISPDGRKLAFSSDRDGNYEIYVLDLTVSGATPVRLTTATGEDVGPSWSPDGSSIAFTSHRDGNAEIYIMTATGAQQTNFTNRPVDDFEPSWGVDPDAPSGARFEESEHSVPAKGRHNTDPALSVGILLPTMLGAAWLLHRRRR
jgi:Tol biopolymer transport system component